MGSFTIRQTGRLRVLVVFLGLTLFYYIAGEPSWSGNILRLGRASLSLNNTSAGHPPHKSSFTDIFFLETGGRGLITARMACAVESAARVHPNWTVHLLSVNDDDHARNDSCPFVNLLRSMRNVILTDIRPLEEFQGTPLHSWYQSGVLKNSSYPVEHLADALRLAVLYRRGGVYLDADVVMLRPLDSLEPFVCQSPVANGELVSNGFLGFHRHDPFVMKLLKHASKVYNPKQWNSIGPLLLRHVTLTYCGKRNVKQLVEHRCRGHAGFTIMDHRKFLPVRYDKCEMFFAANASKTVWHMCNGSYVMHVYSKRTSKMLTEAGSAYRQAAEAYCPYSLKLSLDLNGTF